MRQIEIFRFWLPLYASWLLMTGEAALVSAAVNRLPDEVVMLAALGIVYSLAVLIESPIINLLATATALVHDRASYLQVRRFTVHWMVLLSVVSYLVAMTPLFDVLVRDAMAVPEEVADAVRPGLQILMPWSAAIAWRRFCQGVLIHFGRTRQVAQGTVVRLAGVVATAAPLVAWGGWSGIHVGASALLVGVVAEALYATRAVRPLLASVLSTSGKASEPDRILTYRALFAYHMPLAGTAVLTLFVHPVISFSLTRLDEPTLSLAAWPLVFHLTLLMRASALALPEVIIALCEDEPSYQALRRFSFALAWLGLAAMAAISLTPLAGLYLYGVQSAAPEIGELARHGIVLALPMSAIVTLICWQRGLLMKWRRTGVVNGGMVVRLLVFLPVLAVGVVRGWPGIPTAVWSVNLSIAAELAFLILKARRAGLRR